MGQSETQGGVEPFNVLGASNLVQRTKNDTFIDSQTIGMTSGFEVGNWEALSQTKGPYAISEADETADDFTGQSVHGQPNPSGLCLPGHKGA